MGTILIQAKHLYHNFQVQLTLKVAFNLTYATDIIS